ncbi:MAG: PD-(D/E)XK nuclease family protein [Porticoccaceae bacterium]
MSSSEREHRPFFSIASLVDAIAAGALVITPNLRLSRTLHDAWNHHCRNAGLPNWERPAIMPLETWLETCWDQLQDAAYPPALAGITASACQERTLWEQVIDDDNQLPAEISAENFAQLAQRGWKLVRQWRIDLRHLAALRHSGADHLIRLGLVFARRLEKLALVDAETRTETVLRGFRDGALEARTQIVLVGFQTLPPLAKTTLEAAAEQLEYFSHQRPPAQQCLFTASDASSEIASAARWASRLAAEAPDARIGIVVPQLNARQKAVERIFRNTFEPAACLPHIAYRPAPFNISAGTPLSEAPPVTAALALLRLLNDSLPSQELCALLVNPFWGDADREGSLRSQAQSTLLESGLLRLSVGKFRQLLSDLAPDTSPGSLSQRLVKLATLQRSQPGTLNFRHWRELFSECLDVLGWPGSRSPDSLEFQQLSHWQALLDSFAELDEICAPVSAHKALQRLEQLAGDHVFHPETPPSNVQVLGLLEAAGLEFDHLWVMNMDNRHWPETIAPHPLVPVSLQRQLAMPRACPERELALARDLITLFATSADNLVFSYAARDGDIHLRPSALLGDLPAAALAGASGHHPWLDLLADGNCLEIVEDARGPAYAAPQDRIRGGSRLLAAQAQCPFNAFAQWRLGAEPLRQPRNGLGADLRGMLVHDSLDILWRELGNHATLLALDDSAVADKVAAATSQALNHLFRSQTLLQRSDFAERLLQLELERLNALLRRWLDVERERPPFSVVETEKAVELEIAGLRIALRLDRLDHLPQGFAVIDYKTGRTSLAGLAADRLTEPQLALYALALDEAPAAVAYAAVTHRKTAFEGIGESNTVPGCKSLAALNLPEFWPDALSAWRDKLATLILEFRDGRADVTFYGQAAQRGGHLEPLNRVAGAEDIAILQMKGAAS